MFNPGSFRHRISFLEPPTETDESGELLGPWPELATVSASKEPILGRELYTALTAETVVEVKFKSRYIRGITNDMRIRHGSELYEIISAIDVNAAQKELLCYCKAVKV